MKSRRQFFKLAEGTGILAAGVSSVYGSSSVIPPAGRDTKDLFSLGMASYTFNGSQLKGPSR